MKNTFQSYVFQDDVPHPLPNKKVVDGEPVLISYEKAFQYIVYYFLTTHCSVFEGNNI
jgi:hypothetical protein